MLRFVVEGFWHILDGTDHLLFLACPCLVIPFRRLRPLIVIVTSFTVAHSITLLASAFGFAPDALWFPPLIETLIAVTIVFMALENIAGSNAGRRWIFAFVFGLIHGFGFSFALREQLQFAGDHLVTSLLGFNLGVEIGQLGVLVVLVPALNLLFKYVVDERMGVIILSALVAHTGWHWMLERGEVLARFPFPTLDAAFVVTLMRGAMAALGSSPARCGSRQRRGAPPDAGQGGGRVRGGGTRQGAGARAAVREGWERGRSARSWCRDCTGRGCPGGPGGGG